MISIIVPIYNVENFLEDCLLSIQNQTYTDFECIMVNDGSTDRSAEIAQKFVNSDERFKLITQENAGLSAARNTGLRHVTGDYVTFLDSDDLLHHHYLEICRKEIADVDIVCTDMIMFSNDNEIDLDKVEEYNENVYPDSRSGLQANLSRKLPNNMTFKIFTREVIKDIHFPEGRIYEDFPVTLHLYKKGYRIKKISFVGYFYRKGHASILTSSMNERDWDIFYICEQVEKDFSDKKELLPLVYKLLAGNILYQFLYKTNFLTKGRSRHKKMIRAYLKKSSNLSLKEKLIKLSPDAVWLVNYLRNKIEGKKYV